MCKFLGYFIIFNREIFISTICYLFNDSSFIYFQNFNCLFSIMDVSYSALNKFFLKCCFFLFYISMWKFNLGVIRLFINFIPNKGKYILGVPVNIFKYFTKWFFRILWFFIALIDYICQLIKFIFWQELYVHHIDKSPTIF